jgi:hypothetical protein
VKQEPSEVPRERHGRNPLAFRPGRTSITHVPPIGPPKRLDLGGGRLGSFGERGGGRNREVLGYAPRYSSLDALHEALAWLVANGQADVGGQEF